MFLGREIFTSVCQCVTVHTNEFCPRFCVDHRKQDDITQSGNHLWTQPLAQAKKLRQRVCGPEFCPCGGELSRHQRGPKDDQYI